jgi:hypothetical protein
MKSKLQMLADSIALIEKLDYEYYKEDEDTLKKSIILSKGYDIKITSAIDNSERIETSADREHKLDKIQAARVPILAALSNLRQALNEANNAT